jgi:hypothetical protein
LRDIKAVLMTDATASQIVLSGCGHKEGPLDRALDVKCKRTAGDSAAIQQVQANLARTGVLIDTPFARALWSKLKENQNIDRLLANCERRRGDALRELDRHRPPLAQKLRLAIAREEAGLVPDAPPLAAPEPK